MTRGLWRSYRFRDPLGEIHIVDRGAPAPKDGVLRNSPYFFLMQRLPFLHDCGAGGGSSNDREMVRLLDDLGPPDTRARAMDAGHRLRAADRWADEIRLRFDVYEVRFARVIAPLDGEDEPVLGPDPNGEAAPRSKSWVGLTLVDQEAAPVPNRKYRIVAPDGTMHDGTLDSKGAAILRDLDPGNCQIWCPYVEPHEETSYEVQEGDHISGIAQRFGFDDYSVVWNDPGNADLRSKRQDPHVLQPGDTVVIPEVKGQPPANKPTGARHKFQIQRSPLVVRIKFLGLRKKPITGATFTVADVTSLTTDGDGLIETAIDKTAASVVLDGTSTHVDLTAGDLNPSDDASEQGWRARLFNLGFLWDSNVEDTDDEMTLAIADFQAQYSLPATGQLDGSTMGKLLQVYGC
jgi:N-acetylmuramoyl-L-alanine amidase